jgi:hypothetical protein
MFDAPADTEQYRAPEAQAELVSALRELREIGMELARALRVQALAAMAPPEPGSESARQVTQGDPVAMFTRVARAVRMTVALEMRLAEPGPDREARRREALQARQRRKAAVCDVVQQIVETEAPPTNHRMLLGLLDAQLDRAEKVEAEFTHLPIGVLVARICRVLGVRPDWSAWADTEWAHEEARAQAPGSPFTGPKAPPLRPRADGTWPSRAPPGQGPPGDGPAP